MLVIYSVSSAADALHCAKAAGVIAARQASLRRTRFVTEGWICGSACSISEHETTLPLGMSARGVHSQKIRNHMSNNYELEPDPAHKVRPKNLIYFIP